MSCAECRSRNGFGATGTWLDCVDARSVECALGEREGAVCESKWKRYTRKQVQEREHGVHCRIHRSVFFAVINEKFTMLMLSAASPNYSAASCCTAMSDGDGVHQIGSAHVRTP